MLFDPRIGEGLTFTDSLFERIGAGRFLSWQGLGSADPKIDIGRSFFLCKIGVSRYAKCLESIDRSLLLNISYFS